MRSGNVGSATGPTGPTGTAPAGDPQRGAAAVNRFGVDLLTPDLGERRNAMLPAQTMPFNQIWTTAPAFQR